MIGGSVESRTLSSQIVWSWCFELVAATRADVDKLIFGIENGAFAMRAAIVTARGEFGRRHLWIDISSL